MVVNNLDLVRSIQNAKKSGEDFLKFMHLRFKSYNFKKALSLKIANGWKELSYIELSNESSKFSGHLIDIGIQQGDKIAILSESRPEWAIAFFGSVGAGGTIVPLDVKLTLSELNTILSDCLPSVLCVSSNYKDTARQLQQENPAIKHIFVIDETDKSCEFPRLSDIKITAREAIRDTSLEETAIIVYTSGTTGNPKGVMISFGNIMAQFKDFKEVFDIDNTDSLLSILPLNHLLELNGGLLEMLRRGTEITYTSSLNPKEIVKTMQEKQISYMIAVPLFIKMLKSSIEKEINKQGQNSKRLFNIMYNLAKFIPSKAIRRVLFSKIHKKFGGRLKGFISGGAPLDIDVAEFFDRIGISVYQGYGLTETSPTVSTNNPKFNRIGSVGKPMPSVKVRLTDRGEILVKGQNVMQGYYNKPEMTAEVIDEDGWFHTGDIGEFDQDGYLYITGRIKNMIVLGGGKKIFPEEVEAALDRSSKIKELCVMSVKIQGGSKDGTEEVCAVVVPSDDIQSQHNGNYIEVKKEMTAEVNKLAQDIAQYKRPTVVAVHTDELPKTTTRKIKRNAVLDWYYTDYLTNRN